MLTAFERNAFPKAPECRRKALSAWASLEDIEALRLNIPRLNNHVYAYFEVTPDHGVEKQTGRPNHHSLWFYRTQREHAADLLHPVEDEP